MEQQQQQDQQPRRSRGPENPVAPPQQPPPPPEKCPRCESLNTKFCYYNNYSLSQPRYFCKTCRRYWTQGGTLRNVPVGGGCRKGKRSRPSSSSGGGEGSGSVSRSQPLPPPPAPPIHQHQLQLLPQMASMEAMISSIPGLPTSQSVRNFPWPPAPPSSLYSSGGLWPSLAAMQSLSQQPQGINQPINIGGGVGSSIGAGNMPVLQGFNFPSLKSQQAPEVLQIQQPRGFHAMGNGDENGEPLYPSGPGQNFGQPPRTESSWTRTNTNNPGTSSSIFWNNFTSSTSMAGSSSLNPNQWPNLPGFGAPP